MADKKIDLAYIQFRTANAAIHQSNLAVGANGAIQTIFGPSAPLAGGGGGAPAPSGAYYSGTNFGYDVGGSSTNGEFIYAYPFSSDTDTINVGQLGPGSPSGYKVFESTGTASGSYGYVVGGQQGTASLAASNNILRFPFANPAGVAADVGQLTAATRLSCGGIADLANDRGYNVGGLGTNMSMMNRYPTVSPGNATNVASLSTPRYWGAGSCSETAGYVIGGETPADTNAIEKFPFASNSSSNQPATLVAVNRSQHGHQSETHIYVSGGITDADVLQKFTYAADTPSSDIAELSTGNSMHGGTSSNISGYMTHGYPTNNRIDKFPFASDQTSTNIGNTGKGTANYRTTGNIQY